MSNGVPIFEEPRRARAKRTLAVVAGVLAVLLAGIAALSHVYGIGATEPGGPGYRSVLSELVAAVAGRGVAYGITMGAVFAVLCLSANTSFAGFPRLCRSLALDRFLPEAFAHAGRRLVYGAGIVLLAVLAGALLVVFRGVTDRLIPLFAVGAPVPRLVQLRTEYRQVGDPLLTYVRALAAENPGRFVAVVVPDLVEARWYHFLLFSHTAALRLMLRFRGGPQVVVVDAPWHLREPRSVRRRRERARGNVTPSTRTAEA